MALTDRSDALLASLNAGDVGAAVEALGGGTVVLSPLDRAVSGSAEAAALVGGLFAAVPDLRMRAVRTYPGEHTSAVEVMMAGTLTGETPWWPPTGRPVEVLGRMVWRSHPVNGIDLAVSFDLADALNQAGLVPGTSSASGSVMSGWTVALANHDWWGTPHVIAPAPVRAVRRSRRRRRVAGVFGAAAVLVAVAVVSAGVYQAQHRDGVEVDDGAGGPVTAGTAGTAVTSAGPDLTATPDATSGSAATVSAAPTISPPPIPIAPEQPVRLSAAVLFDFNKAVLRPEAAPVLSDLAARILATGRVGTVTVTGYTDDIGSDAAAAQLSLARAAAVAVVLRDLLSATALEVVEVGAGKANPVAPNDSEANRALNRRVEIGFMA